MHKLKKMLLPLLLVIAMLLMSVPSFAASSPTPKALAEATFSSLSYVYNGLERKPTVKKVVDASGNVVPAYGYSVSYENNISAGTATIVISAKAPYVGVMRQDFTIRQAKAYAFINKANQSKVTVSLKKINKLKKGKQLKVGVIDLYLQRSGKKFVYAWKDLTYSSYSVSKADKKYLIVKKNKHKNGDIYVKKGLKKGKHKITLKIKNDGQNYQAVTRTVTVVVK